MLSDLQLSYVIGTIKEPNFSFLRTALVEWYDDVNVEPKWFGHVSLLIDKKKRSTIYVIQFLSNGSMNREANYVCGGLKRREVFSFL